MKKKFDAVKFQRMIREELGKKYILDREDFLRDLKKKYGYLRKIKDQHTLQITAGLRRYC